VTSVTSSNDVTAEGRSKMNALISYARADPAECGDTTRSGWDGNGMRLLMFRELEIVRPDWYCVITWSRRQIPMQIQDGFSAFHRLDPDVSVCVCVCVSRSVEGRIPDIDDVTACMVTWLNRLSIADDRILDICVSLNAVTFKLRPATLTLTVLWSMTSTKHVYVIIEEAVRFVCVWFRLLFV